jgi:hypothetical protein
MYIYDVIPGQGTITCKSSDQKQKFKGKNKFADDTFFLPVACPWSVVLSGYSGFFHL